MRILTRTTLLILSTLIGAFIFSPECKAEIAQIRELKVKPGQVQMPNDDVIGELQRSITKLSLLIKQIEPDLNQSFQYEHRFYDNLESIDLAASSTIRCASRDLVMAGTEVPRWAGPGLCEPAL